MMAENRFTVNYRENTRLYEVKDNLHILDCGGFAIEYSAKKCSEELNALNDENEQLKKSVKRQQSSNDECAKLIKEQQKENEQLKAEINQLKHDLALYEEETAKELGIDWNE